MSRAMGMICQAALCGAAAMVLAVSVAPARAAIYAATISPGSTFRSGIGLPRLRTDRPPLRAFGRLRVRMVIAPSCTVSLPEAGELVQAARILCTRSVPWLVNLTPGDDVEDRFVTLDFVPVGDAWAPSKPADSAFVPLRFNLDY